MESDPFGTFKGIEPEKHPEHDREEPDLYDAVAEYRRNHPQPAEGQKPMSDEEANRLLYEIERTELTNNIYRMVSALQQICDLAAEKLGLNTEIIIEAHPDQPKKKQQVTIYSLPAHHDTQENPKAT